MAVSLDEISMSVSFCNDRTPATDAASSMAPAALSTVARPIKPLHRHQLGAIPEWKLDESAIQSAAHAVTAESAQDGTIGLGNETSLGLLPPELLDQTSSNHHQPTLAAWQSPDPENLDGSYIPHLPPSSTPGSVETVIKKPVLPENLNGTREERFSDFSGVFPDAPPQHFDDEFLKEAAFSVDGGKRSDVRSFLDAEEAENAEKFRFEIQDGEIADESSRFSDYSMFEYLRKGSSRVGKSLDEDSSSQNSNQRPNFGFDGKIRSPKYQPVAVLADSSSGSSVSEEYSVEYSIPKVNQSEVKTSKNHLWVTKEDSLVKSDSDYHLSVDGKAQVEDSSTGNSNQVPNFGFGSKIRNSKYQPAEALCDSLSASSFNEEYSVEYTIPKVNASEKITSKYQPSTDGKSPVKASLSQSSHQRPNFAFDSKIRSLKYQPADAVEASSGSSVIEEQHSDEYSIQKANESETRTSKCHSVIKEGSVEVAKSELLELTIQEELLQGSGTSVDLETISKILSQAPAGKSPQYYAELVLNAHSNTPDANESVNVEDLLPSFMEEDKENKTKNLRHSSPIKCNPNVQTAKDDKKFPLESDRVSVHFFNVGVDSEEDQFLVIKNTMESKFLSVRLMIRGGECFKFKENWAKTERVKDNSQGLDVKLAPGGKRDVFVTFKPSSSGFFSGQLILKPQNNNNRLKAKIDLVGYAGNADIRVFDSSANPIANEISSTAERIQLTVVNLGSADGFYKLLAFSEPDESIEASNIEVLNGSGVLKAGQETRVILRNLEKCSSSVFVVIYKGGDLVRRVYCHSKNKAGKELFPPFGRTNFDIPLSNNLPEELEKKVSSRDASHLYEKLQKVSLHMSFKEEVFVRLPVEETMSESMLIPECEFSTASSFPAANKQQLPQLKKKRHREGIYLEKEVVEFNSRSTVGKVTIRNRTENHETFQLGQVNPPFFSYHTVVTVQPHHYLSIPIKFKPPLNVEVEHLEQLFIIKNDRHQLTATLKGSL